MASSLQVSSYIDEKTRTDTCGKEESSDLKLLCRRAERRFSLKDGRTGYVERQTDRWEEMA